MFEYTGSGKITLRSLFVYSLDKPEISFSKINVESLDTFITPESVYSYFFSRIKNKIYFLFSYPTFSLFNQIQYNISGGLHGSR